MTQLDTNLIDDGLKGYWFNCIKVKNFSFYSHVYKTFEFNEGDVIIHKEKKEGEKFPEIRYAIVLDEEIYVQKNADIKKHLGEQIIKIIKETNKLPQFCEFAKGFKNGNVQINYKPERWTSFAIKITPKMYLQEFEDFDEKFDVLETIIKDLKVAEEKKTGNDDCQLTIEPILHLPNLQYNIVGNTKAYIEGKITEINKRRNIYMGHSNSFYLINLMFVKVSFDNGNSFTPTEQFNIRISKELKNKIETNKVEIGNTIGFNAYIKKDKQLGYIAQNIRAINVI